MEQVTYFFASLISFFGVVIGSILIKISPEEQKPLERHFLYAKKALLLMIFGFMGFYFFYSIKNLAILSALLAVIFVFGKSDATRTKTIAEYTTFGVIFFMSSENPSLFAIESALMTIYGIPFAPVMHKKEKNFRFVFYCLILVAISNLLFLLSPFLASYF